MFSQEQTSPIPILQVFTDGAGHKDRASYGIWSEDYSEYGMLPQDQISVGDQELNANRSEIYSISYYIENAPQHILDNSSVVICTDCKFIIYRLQKVKARRLKEFDEKQYCQEAEKFIKRNFELIERVFDLVWDTGRFPHGIRFIWIKGHAHINGNCEADWLTKGAMAAGDRSQPIDETELNKAKKAFDKENVTKSRHIKEWNPDYFEVDPIVEIPPRKWKNEDENTRKMIELFEAIKDDSIDRRIWSINIRYFFDHSKCGPTCDCSSKLLKRAVEPQI